MVFTALHGTGRNTVYELLQQAGFRVTLEPTQAEYDGAFPEVPYGTPNPEVPSCMECHRPGRRSLVRISSWPVIPTRTASGSWSLTRGAGAS